MSDLERFLHDEPMRMERVVKAALAGVTQLGGIGRGKWLKDKEGCL
jgi:hypothetical protein